jgi:hypothetical protein
MQKAHSRYTRSDGNEDVALRLAYEPKQTNEANFVSTKYYESIILIIGLTVVNYHLLARGKD